MQVLIVGDVTATRGNFKLEDDLDDAQTSQASLASEQLRWIMK